MGLALGFCFLTLLFVIVAVLVHMGIYIDILLGSHANINVTLFSSLSIIAALINAAIVYGLRNQKRWAIIIGSVEMLMLIVAVIANVVLTGFSDIVSSLYWLIIASFFLVALRFEYNLIRSRMA